MTTKEAEGVVALIMLALSPVLFILHGWALAILWAWFAVPIFHLPALSVPLAIGLRVTFAALAGPPGRSIDPNKSALERLINELVFVVAQPLWLLLIGWVVKQ